MAIERYCINGAKCPKAMGRKCANDGLAGDCPFEYVAASYGEAYRYNGTDAPPRRWTAADGTIVYRSYAEYVEG